MFVIDLECCFKVFYLNMDKRNATAVAGPSGMMTSHFFFKKINNTLHIPYRNMMLVSFCSEMNVVFISLGYNTFLSV